MKRSIPSPADGDRTTTPGVGEDSRATLPDALPPVRPSRDFKQTIPMGSSFQSDWPSRMSTTSQSGLHAIDARALSAPPLPTGGDDKRMIGTGDLGRTLRVMTVPPPAGRAPGRSSFPPPPKPAQIAPAPTITLSPEIEIPKPAPAQPSPSIPKIIPARPPAESRAAATPTTPAAPATPTTAADDANHSGWITARRWTLIFAAVSLSALIGLVAFALLGPMAARPTPAPATAERANATPPEEVDLRPATTIVTNPPGAEIVLRGALVANTPARITRPSYESLYLLRLRGYQPQLVALSMHSPETLNIDLQPLAGTTPTPVPASTEAP